MRPLSIGSQFLINNFKSYTLSLFIQDIAVVLISVNLRLLLFWMTKHELNYYKHTDNRHMAEKRTSDTVTSTRQHRRHVAIQH